MWFVGALTFLLGLVSRLWEPFLPPHKREKFRALRKEMEGARRDYTAHDKRLRNAQSPEESWQASREFMAKYGGEEANAKLDVVERESEYLRTVLRETGEDFPTAATRYREYVQENPSSHLGRTFLVGTLRQMGKWDEALEVLRELRALEENEPNSRVRSLMTRISIGQVLYDKGEFDAAIAEFISLLSEPSKDARTYHGIIYLSLGTVYLAKCQPREAQDAWKKAIKADKTGVVAERAKELLKNNS